MVVAKTDAAVALARRPALKPPPVAGWGDSDRCG
jgi:hypothetical protein